MQTPTTAPTAILTMGLPGAGKSTVMAETYDLDQYTIIDPDAPNLSRDPGRSLR